MFEITPQNAVQYLRERNLIPADANPLIEPLGGGISSTVLKVNLAENSLVIKQPLQQLRVSVDWRMDRNRILVERDCMVLLNEILPPGSVPEVVFTDEENFICIMTCAPWGGLIWKQALLGGYIDLQAAARAGELLARIHLGTLLKPEVQARFGDQAGFVQARIDPYFRAMAQAHPELGAIIEAQVEQLLHTRWALVHGDYAPKNIIVYPDHVMLLDFEVAHFGNPAFDAAFCLSLLILGAIKFPDRAPRQLTAAAHFWRAYWQLCSERIDLPLEEMTISLIGCLVLARIDGKSKVEYITDDPTRNIVRRFARALLTGKETSIEALLYLAAQHLPVRPENKAA